LEIKESWVHLYFIFDVCDSINFDKISPNALGSYESVLPKVPTSSVKAREYLQFSKPLLRGSIAPLYLDFCKNQGIGRVNIYDYGAIAIRYSFQFLGTFDDLTKFVVRLNANEYAFQVAERAKDELINSCSAAINKPHDTIVEDYLMVEVNEFSRPIGASELLASHRMPLAHMLALEERELSQQEIEEVLKVSFSFAEDELAVFTWDLAFLFDDKAGADTVDSLIEFANTQLAELRTYDNALDKHLDEIYRTKAEKVRKNWWKGGILAERQAEALRQLLVDLHELSERAHNTLKFVGDAYYARVYRGLAQRLALGDWQKQLEGKLSSIQEIYRFYHDQAEHGRAEFLEVIIIVLISVEIIMSAVHFVK
jgi:hypothetical protein